MLHKAFKAPRLLYLTKHHLYVAPTWVMHDSHYVPECSPHTREGEGANGPVTMRG